MKETTKTGVREAPRTKSTARAAYGYTISIPMGGKVKNIFVPAEPPRGRANV
ncbi:MAG: hypothetical protein VB118_04685 [Oscillospiraceae bacterium]|nr:hypothetical protein [Oscillospiraceae bacterium]